MLLKTKIGELPEAKAFLPTTLISQTSLLAASAFIIDYSARVSNHDPITIIASLGLGLTSLVIYDRHKTRDQRSGWLFEKPWSYTDQVISSSTINVELTNHFKEVGLNFVVTETKAAQYRIFKIKNKTPKKIKEQLGAISMILDIPQDNLVFIQNYEKLTSAILAPRPIKEWDNVPLDKTALTKGKLIGYIGKTVNGTHVTYDRSIEPHILTAGDTNSGKTEAIRVDIESMRLSGLNPEIYIIDPKDDMSDIKADWYTNDIEEGITKLEELSKLADQRKKKYNKAGCKNYFEYQKRIDQTERPLMIWIDEGADLLAENPLEKPAKDTQPLHKRAFGILYYITRKNRAGGLFLGFGIQHPKAETLPTLIRNNLGAKLVLSMADDVASKVALGKTGAENLPKLGAFLFKTSLSNAPILGRGAYIN